MAPRSLVLVASLLAWTSAEFDASSAPLDADDECSDSTCALNALQQRGLGPDAMMSKINAAFASKLGSINDHLKSGMKSKDPMEVHIKKDSVNFDKLYGMSGLHINSMKAVGFHAPNLELDLSGSWSGQLTLKGSASKMGRNIPMDVHLSGVTFSANPINTQLNKDALEIQNFGINSVAVHIGSANVQVHVSRPFLARMISGSASKKINEAKGKIAAKMGEKMKQVLSTILNSKMKGAINQKIKEKMR